MFFVLKTRGKERKTEITNSRRGGRGKGGVKTARCLRPIKLRKKRKEREKAPC